MFKYISRKWIKYIRKLSRSMTKKSLVNNMKRYVRLSLILAILWVFLSLYAIFYPIQNIQNNISELKYDYPKIYNKQLIDTSKMSWDEIIITYFNSINNWDFEKACSLITTRHCSMYDVNLFTQWVKDKRRKYFVEYQDWIEVEEVKYSWVTTKNTKQEIRCVKEKLRINNQSSYIYQTQQYYIIPRPDWWKEIWKTVCEKIFKENRWDITKNIRTCWVEKNICYKKIFLN